MIPDQVLINWPNPVPQAGGPQEKRSVQLRAVKRPKATPVIPGSTGEVRGEGGGSEGESPSRLRTSRRVVEMP